MIRCEDRLSLLDRFFLAAERAHTPMHIGAVLVFETNRLARGRRRVDIAALRAHVGARLHRVPRFRQRLAWTPLEGRVLWIDDDRFDPDRHVHHLRLQRREGEAALGPVAGELLSLPLDRERPLWELWIVDGFAEDRFALITKLHHCMADGIGGVEQLASLLDASPDEAGEPPEAARPWTPQPPPAELALLGEAASLARSAAGRLGAVGRSLLGPPPSWSAVERSVRAAGEALAAALPAPAATPINRPVGPNRHIEWLTFPLPEVRLVKHRLGGTLNDVVLATVAGALRRYLRRRGVDVAGSELTAAVPVSMRDPSSSVANQVSLWLVSLPVGEPDACARLAAVRETTSRLKAEGSAHRLYDLAGILDGLPPAWLDAGVRLLQSRLPFHLVVTNVPGPPFPFFLRGARLVAGYPSVPLFENQGLGIALFSYDGTLHWGFNADPEQVPDLEEIVYAVAASFCELLERATADLHPRGAAFEPLHETGDARHDSMPAAHPGDAGAAGAPHP